MKHTDFGDRMKEYEQAEAGRKLMPLLPILIRLDGKSFHRWTEKLARPYDIRLSQAMVDTTRFLMEETGAVLGYTQSDEITLVLYSHDYESQIYFDGKIQKIVSVTASMATAKFNALANLQFELSKCSLGARPLNDKILDGTTLAKDANGLAFFDSRVWNCPNEVEAANAVLFRETDSTKNSISMAARCFFSHNALQDKSGPEMQEMMFSAKGVNFNDYPAFFKRGTFLQRRHVTRELTAEELARIPEPHRTEATGKTFERGEIRQMDMPRFTQVTNRVDVVFNGADPITEQMIEEDGAERNEYALHNI